MIDREARLAGFDAVAVTSPDAIPLAPARLKQFVAEGFHGSMGWIAAPIPACFGQRCARSSCSR
jgi:epoxyqueuosine reductase